MRTIEAFTFSELTEAQQKAAFNNYSEKFSQDYDWWENTVEDIKEALEALGFSDVGVYFSGFWSQGDGAQFVGSYAYKKGSLKQVEKSYPNWEDLHELAKALQEASRKNFYAISFRK